MEQPVRAHVSKMLQSSKFRRRAAAVFACAAVIVALGVARALRLSGVAMTHTELVLDCHYDGHGAHTHNEDCYDANGKLVCPLKERALHTHDDSCYTETRELTCGQEEGAGAHTHTDDCYDEDGNLVCGQEESEGHQHTDECYKVTRELTCGKDEITDEHVHGPGCFKEVTVDDGEAEEEPEAEAQAEVETEAEATDDTTKADDEVAMPKQEFQAELKETDEKGHEFTSVVVAVKAPEGAFPEGTTMEATWVEERDLKGVEAKTKAALERESGHEVEIKQYQAVDIVFRDADGKEIEPARKVEVKLTSVLVPETDDPALVHVVDKTKDNQQKDVDAEVLTKVDVVNRDDEDKRKGNEDTLKFKTDEFSPYVICDYVELTAGVITADGARYTVSVTYDEAAGIPEGAKLEASEYAEPGRDWTTYVDQITDELGTEPGYARLFDITIMADGKPVQPKAPVHVRIALDDADELTDDAQVVHFGKDGLETLDATVEDGTVSFEASGFSVYAVVGEGEQTQHARMEVNFWSKGQKIATMYVKNDDTLEELQTILYDPGAGTLSGREIFKGWTTNPNYTVADGDNSLDIEQIRVLARDKQITELDKVNYYAIILNTWTATYKDGKGVTLGVQNAYTPYGAPRADYMVNMSYTPEDDTHIFEGWNVEQGGNNIADYTTGKVYPNGSNISISGDVTFSVNAPEGHWLVFDENGKGATYNAPVFIKSGETTVAPTAPTRRGYTFDGWYTNAAAEADDTGYKEVSGEPFTFGGTLSDKTTLYAKWTPAATSNYTVIIWKQNLEADGYDFVESIVLQGTTNDFVDSVTPEGTGDNTYASVNGEDKQFDGFHLKEIDQNVKITPEGNAVVNVRYDRNEYTLRFYYARSYEYTLGGTTTNQYVAVATANNGQPTWNSGRSYNSNTTYYRNTSGDVAYYNNGSFYRTRTWGWGGYNYSNPITGTIYVREPVTSGGTTRTFIQVNCNNDGFKQGRANGRNLEQSLAYYLVNDYQRVDHRNTWKDVNNSTINGDATNLVSSEFLSRTGATLGTHEISGVTTDVIGSNKAVANRGTTVDMTYYYLDIKVRYEQSLAELWPVPNVAFVAQQMTSYNEANDTGNYTTITPLLVGTWSTGNNIGGMYSTMSPDLFVGDDKVAYLDIYWRFEKHYEYRYNVYFSTLENEESSTTYNGKDYTLRNDLSYIVANGQQWGNTSQTDTGSGYYDVNTVTFDGTNVAGRHDVNNGTINVYYDRIVRNVVFKDGIYVDGNGNTIQNKKDSDPLRTQAVTYGEDLEAFNDYYRPADTKEYIFEGWYMDPEGQQPYTFSGTMPTHDVTVYAKWRQVQYRVFLHPNTDDPSLDWGSDNQDMNFRVSYGDKISAPTGRRTDYEFVGWYTDPSCSASSLFNADTVLNDTTVTADYDKNVDMTDPMDKWGNGATRNADVNRPWITKKFDLYAKWRAKLTGAQGIGVKYDANGGSNAPTDKSLYLDQAEATAQAAPTAPPAPAGTTFKFWVVQTWDKDAGAYRDTDVTVLPGDSFTVLRDNARRTENPDHTPTNPSYTYTVQLRAEYTTAEGHEPTHIHFYGNIQDKNGNAIAGVTAAPEGNEPKDITTYHNNIKINQAVDILTIGHVLGQQSNLYNGYKFLGWAKTRNAVKPWLKLNDDGTTYTVEQDGKTYSSVTQVAADERTPYEDLYAVWERKTYTVTVEKIVTEGAYKNEPFAFASTFNPALDSSVQMGFSLVGNAAGATVEGVTYTNTKQFLEVPYGTKFSITETATDYDIDVKYDCANADDATKNGTNKSASNGGELTVDGDMTVRFTNTRQKGTLKVSKVTSPAGIADSKAFKVSVKNSAGKYLQSTSDISFGDNPQWFDVSVATALTIANLPTDTYTVVEDTKQVAVDGYRFDGVTYGPNTDGTAAVTKDDVTELTVTNGYTKLVNATVTKVLDDPYPNGSESFTFTAKLMEGDTDVTSDYLGEDASFTLTPAGDSKTDSKVLENLPVGAVLTVTEAADTEYETTIKVSGQTSQTGALTIADDTNSNTVEFTNTRKTSVVDFKKVDENGTTELSGATFELKIKDGGTSGSGDPTYVVYPNGAITVGHVSRNLVNGEYELTETNAPAGYIILTNKVYFKVSDDGVEITETPTLPGSTTPVATAEAAISTESKGTVQVKNVPGKPLPVTGGVGTTLYTLVGTMIVALGAVALVRRRRVLA